MSNILAGFKKVNVFAGTMASKTLGVKTDVNNSISRPPTELLFEAIAQFLDRYDCGAAVPTTDDVVYSRLRHAADTA